METQIGLRAKTYRTPLLTTRAQCGGRTSTRCHIAEKLLRDGWMAVTATPFSTLQSQSPFWKFLIWVEVSVVVVDQFSYLWDFVLTGETENEHTGCQHSSATSRAHTGCFFADQGELNIGERANQVLFSFLYSLFSNDQTRNDPKPSRPCDLRLGSLVRMDLKREHMHLIKS